MKKILSLMALLLLTVTTAWAATVNDLVAVGPGYTFIADNITSNGTVKLTKNTLYDNGRIFAPTSNSVSTEKGNSTIGGVSHLNSLRLKNGQDYLIIKVDGPCLITFYTYGDNTRGVKVGTSDPGYSEDTGCDEYGRQTAGTTQWTCNVTAAGYVKIASYNNDFYIAGFEVTATEKTVYFDNKSNWETVYAYAWYNDGTDHPVSAEWPGDAITVGESGMYEWTTTGDPTYILFHNNSGTQTADLAFVDGATYNVNGQVRTVTFTTDAGWTDVWAYVFSGEGDGAYNKCLGGWPGTQMTSTGEGTWTISFGSVTAPETIIFHNNEGNQTPNLAFVDGKAYEYMEQTYTATFTTDAGWDKVYAFAWTTNGDQTTVYTEAWPGTELTKNTETGLYEVTINTYGDAPAMIQFNGGTDETKAGDWAFVDGKAYAYIINPLFAIKSGVTYTYGQTVYVADADRDVVATLTFGNKGENGANFNETTDEPDKIEGYASFSARTNGGNGVNGNLEGGTTYTIKPLFNGKVTIAVKLGSGKKFYIKENGTALDGYNGITKSDTYYGTFDFDVTAGKEYKFYCDGSKLDFYGFNFTGYTKSEPNFKVAGSMTDWNKLYVYADSYTFEDLAAGTYQFKVVDGEAWKGIADMTEVAGGLYWDRDGNVCFKLAEEGNVTVNYKSGELFTVEGNFVAPTVALAGSMNEWSSTANVLVPAEDKKTASVTVALNADYYQLKMIVDGSWLAKNVLYELTRENSSVEHVDQAIDEGPNIAVNADVAGEYTFTWEYATNTLTVTYPVKLPTVALAGTMNDWSASANVLVPAQDKQTASVTVNLAVDDYDFKMVVDGHWLAKDAEYVLHRNWTSVDNVDQEIAYGPNIVLKADYAGDYTFTWEYATNTLTVTFPTPSGELTLSDETDNSAVLTTWDGCVADVTLNRTLKTGMWNTFAAPFSREIPTGWTVKELTGTSFDAENNRVTMSFGDASSIEAGKPYLVKVNTNDDLQLGVFSAVTVNKTVKAVTTFDYIDFIPTLGKTTIEDDAKKVLFLAAENKLKNPDKIPTDIKGFRAYFLLKGDAENARVFNLDLGEGETTGISTMTKNSVMMNNDVYDLQGRRVQNAAQKGVYIMNGRKVVKK